MKSIKVCEYSRSRSFHDDLILKDNASGERSQDQWSSGFSNWIFPLVSNPEKKVFILLKIVIFLKRLLLW